MGQVVSALTGHTEAPPSVVLVPPLLERERKGRSRFAKSSYDRQFAPPALRQLFGDYLGPFSRGVLHFSPGEDPRVSLTAKLGSKGGVSLGKGGAAVSGAAAGGAGGVTLRYEPDPASPFTFLDLKARLGEEGSTASLRGCVLAPGSRVAAHGALPIGGAEDGSGAAVSASSARCGLRYTTPALSLGAEACPGANKVTAAWAVGRAGALVWGIQARPSRDLGALLATPPAALLDSLAPDTSYAVAYCPPGQSAYGAGVFSAIVELRNESTLRVAFLHHLALQRRVRNPFEARDVVGITNYLDVGLELEAPLGRVDPAPAGGRAGAPPASRMALAAAWQANKNLLLKARVGLEGASAAVVARAWWQPALTGAAALSYDARSGQVRLGLTAGVESFKHLRYERSSTASKLAGARVTQRHIADAEDVAYNAGDGLLVPLSDVDDPAVLGQVPLQGADCL